MHAFCITLFTFCIRAHHLLSVLLLDLSDRVVGRRLAIGTPLVVPSSQLADVADLERGHQTLELAIKSITRVLFEVAVI